MTFYIKMVAPVIYYPGQSYEPKKKYVEDPVVWYPEDEIPRLKEKYSNRLEDENGWYVLGFEAKYESFAMKPKFKRLKVPEKCRDCKSCESALTGVPYCHMRFILPEKDLYTNVVYECGIEDIDKRPDWCPIVKANKELDAMPFENRANLDKFVTGLSVLFKADDIWEEEE